MSVPFKVKHFKIKRIKWGHAIPTKKSKCFILKEMQVPVWNTWGQANFQFTQCIKHVNQENRWELLSDNSNRTKKYISIL